MKWMYLAFTLIWAVAAGFWTSLPFYMDLGQERGMMAIALGCACGFMCAYNIGKVRD